MVVSPDTLMFDVAASSLIPAMVRFLASVSVLLALPILEVPDNVTFPPTIPEPPRVALELTLTAPFEAVLFPFKRTVPEPPNEVLPW